MIICKCPQCEGKGWMRAFMALESELGLFRTRVLLRPCPICNGPGILFLHPADYVENLLLIGVPYDD